MRVLKAASGYFALVFAVGFVLGVVRILFLVPALGSLSVFGMNAVQLLLFYDEPL